MKRTCNHCRALEKNTVHLGYYCGLGYEIEEATVIDGVPVQYRPKEQCEKPRTNMNYCELALDKSRRTHKRRTT